MNLNIGKTKFVYPSLNGIRAISIFFVISHHLEQKYHIFSDIFPDIITDFITDGQLGVNFFFIISSFLITTLLLTEESNTNAVSLKKF